MTSIFDDLPVASQPMQRVWKGWFATTPLTVDEHVDVILDDFSGISRWRDCRWQPRVEPVEIDVSEGGPEGPHMITVAKVILPKRHNLLLAVFDNNRRLWVVMWWPYGAQGG